MSWMLVGAGLGLASLALLTRARFVIEETIEIDAPADVVWRVLVDGERYAEWNTQLAWLSGRAERGATLRLRLSVSGAAPYELSPVVTTLEPGARFGWLARTGPPRMFDGEHTFTLTALGESRTRVVNREEYRGVLAPVIQRLPMMRDAPAGFRRMNEELRDRALALL